MPYVSEIVQTGLTLADRVQVGQFVEKARGFERIDTLLGFVSQHGPDVVRKLDEKVDLVLGGVSDHKAKAVDQYNGAKEFVQEKKGNAAEFVQQQKSTALEYKGEMLDFVQQKSGAMQALTSKLAQEKLGAEKSAQLSKQAAQLKAQIALLTSVFVAQCRSVGALPLSLKERASGMELKGLLEAAKSWATQRLEHSPLPAAVEVAKVYAAAVAARPELAVAQARATQLRRATEARFAGAKQLAAENTARLAEVVRAQKELLPSYWQRAGDAARDAGAWARQRVASFRSHQD